MRWGSEGLKKERKGVEIRVDAVEAHTEEYGGWGIVSGSCGCGSSPALDVGSNDCVPDEGFEGRMGKVKTWVRGGYELG